MDFIKIYFWNVVRNNYLNFNGRAKRREFWYFTLTVFIIMTALGFLVAIFNRHSDILEIIFSVIIQVFSLVILLPSLAIGARRLHDANLSGWWQSLAICVVPFLGVVLLTIMFCQSSNDMGSRFDK
jgi:uncharacterized membrane protein YhaH (DUF805 family)